MRTPALAAGLIFAIRLAGQAAPPAPATEQAAPAVKRLEYTGKPMQLDFECSNDDIQWAGLSCTEDEPCPVYLELAAVESVGNKIFAAGNIHSSSGTLYSIILASDDAGHTWREPHDRLRGASLDHIQFVDFENGWVSGQTVQPLPQDPFFLITSDGGKTWRQRPMFSETRPGAIQQFWFSSRNNGSLVLDRGQGSETSRFELYESPNGGETWMLRETNDRQLRLKRSAGGNSDWRIRADAPTKAFVLERRQGDRWASMAAFNVAMRPCKPPAAEPPKPEPVQEQAPAPEQPEPAPAVKRPPPSLKRPPK